MIKCLLYFLIWGQWVFEMLVLSAHVEGRVSTHNIWARWYTSLPWAHCSNCTSGTATMLGYLSLCLLVKYKQLCTWVPALPHSLLSSPEPLAWCYNSMKGTFVPFLKLLYSFDFHDITFIICDCIQSVLKIVLYVIIFSSS